jgi:nucleotide-binding universal stress UspA family protein
METILLATDGSEYARHAARSAIDLAQEDAAMLHVLCVVDRRRFNDPALSSAELATIYADDHAAVSVNEVTEMAAEQDVAVEGETRHGIPEEVILEYAEEIDADVIIIGEHGDHDEHFSGVGQKVLEGSNRDIRVVTADG